MRCASPLAFHSWLRQQRARNRLADIAAALGVSQVAVHRWLEGQRKPSRPVLILAQRLMQDQDQAWPSIEW